MSKNIKKRVFLTEIQKKECIKLYTNDKISFVGIGKIFNISDTAIKRYLNSIGICNTLTNSQYSRKYFINENFFDIINTEEKAYILGFLYADGNIYLKGLKNNISLGLKETDKEILEKISLLIQPEKPLLYIKPTVYNGYKCLGQYRMTINCIHMTKQLINLGCVPRKSLILKFPTEEQVPKHLIHHFIRGYFDGDGWLGKETCSIYSTLDFCNKVKDIFTKVLKINSSIRFRRNIYELSIGGGIQLRKFINWMYKDSKIYLKRKYSRYLDHIEFEKQLNNKNKKNYKKLSFSSEMKNEK